MNSRQALLKFIQAQEQKRNDISKQGFKRNSPYVNEQELTIYGEPNGTNITMQDVDFPLLGIDEFGNKQYMKPGEEYFFPGSRVKEIPLAQIGGKVLPATQTNAATRADSLAVYNNTRALEEYFKKQGYTKEKVKDSKNYKEGIKFNKEWIAFTQKSLKEAKNELVDPWWTQAMKNKRIAEETKYLKNAQKRLSEKIEEVNPKNYIKKLEDSKNVFETKPKDQGKHIDEQNNFIEGKPSMEKFYLPIDENRFYQREQSHGFLDLRSPMPLYDKRITPQDLSVFKSPDSILGDQIMDKMLNSKNKKENEILAKQLNALVYSDNVEMYEYDPIAVMPFDMVPPEQQEERIRKYGTSGVPASIIEQHPEWVTKPITDSEQRRSIQGIQNNLQPIGMQIEASVPKIRPQAIIPKYYDVEDIVNNGRSQTNYQWYPSSGEALRQLSEESGDRRTMVPRYQKGGLLNKTITCSNCGWSWKAADGGNDVTTCHKCGNENKIMQFGGDMKFWRPVLQNGGENMFTVSGNNPMIIPSQGSYPLSYKDRGDRDIDGTLFSSSKKVSRFDANGRPLTRNQIAENQIMWNMQKEAYGPQQQAFNIWKNNPQNTAQGYFNPKEYYDTLEELNSQPDVQLQGLETDKANKKCDTKGSCTTGDTMGGDSLKKVKSNGGLIKAQVGLTMGTTSTENEYRELSAQAAIANAEDKRQAKLEEAQLLAEQKENRRNRFARDIKVRQADGTIKIVNTGSPEYEQMYKAGKIQSTGAGEDNNPYFGGQLPEIVLQQQMTPLLKAKKDYGYLSNKEAFVNRKKDEYIKSLGTNGNWFGASRSDFPENVLRDINAEYNYNQNTKAIEDVAKAKGFDLNTRGNWIYDLTPSEREALINSKYSAQLNPNEFAEMASGVQQLANTMTIGKPWNFKIPGLTQRELEEDRNSSFSALKTFAPLNIPGNAAANFLKNGSDYVDRPFLGAQRMGNVDVWDSMALNPLNISLVEGASNLLVNSPRIIKNIPSFANKALETVQGSRAFNAKVLPFGERSLPEELTASYVPPRAKIEGVNDLFGESSLGEVVLQDAKGHNYGYLTMTKGDVGNTANVGMIQVDDALRGHKAQDALYQKAIQQAQEMGYPGLRSGESLQLPEVTRKAHSRFNYVDEGLRGNTDVSVKTLTSHKNKNIIPEWEQYYKSIRKPRENISISDAVSKVFPKRNAENIDLRLFGFGKKPASSVPTIFERDALFAEQELARANADATAFSNSPFNKQKLQEFRPNQEFNVSNQQARFIDDPVLDRQYQAFRNSGNSDYPENVVEHLGNSRGNYLANDYGDMNDVVMVDKFKPSTSNVPTTSAYTDAMHETTHSRSIRLKATPQEKKIASEAWEPMIKTNDFGMPAEEAFAVQNELRASLGDIKGNRVYTEKDIPEIKTKLESLIKDGHAYLKGVNVEEFNMPALIKSLNKIGLGAAVPVTISSQLQKKNISEKYKQGGSINNNLTSTQLAILIKQQADKYITKN
jgi:predicted GNAT family acetyltransferase